MQDLPSDNYDYTVSYCLVVPSVLGASVPTILY